MAQQISENAIDKCIGELRQRVTEIEGAIAQLTSIREYVYPPKAATTARATIAAPKPKKPRATYGSKTRGGKPVDGKPVEDEPKSTVAVATKPKAATPIGKSATEKIYDALCEHGPMTPKAIEVLTGLPPHVVGARVAMSDQFHKAGDLVKLT